MPAEDESIRLVNKSTASFLILKHQHDLTIAMSAKLASSTGSVLSAICTSLSAPTIECDEKVMPETQNFTTAEYRYGLPTPLKDHGAENDIEGDNQMDYLSILAKMDPFPSDNVVASSHNSAPLTCKLQPATLGNVLVIGIGYVGTLLVEHFSKMYSVTAFDINKERCQHLERHFSGNTDVKLTSTFPDGNAVRFDLCLISVPTLLNESKSEINSQHIKSAVEAASQILKAGSTIVIESTVTVGMTRALLMPSRERGIFVGFSPERVDPGRTYPSFKQIPKIIAGIDEPSLAAINQFYSRCFDTIVPVSSLETAEFSKLMENCQRLVLIAYINEVADACEKHGVDIFEVCKASATKPFGYSPFTPSLGAGGHCIPVNPHYLLHNNTLPMLRSAMEANENRPCKKADVVFHSIKISTEACCIRPKILIIGMGFKKGQSSLAYAPSVAFAERLEQLTASVSYCDDLIYDTRWTRIKSDSLVSHIGRALLDSFDAIAVTQSPSSSLQSLLYSTRPSTKVHWFTNPGS